MFRFALTIFFVGFLRIQVFAQNLVSNPSFEEVITDRCGWCDEQYTISSYLSDWESPNLGSPDMHSIMLPDTCWNYAVGSSYSDTVTCQPGSQVPRTGNVMAGLITYRDSADWREYLQNQLIEPMIIGKLYRVSFYVSLADNSGFSANNLGVYFSEEEQFISESGPLPKTPQIEFSSIISDKENWVHLDTTIIASESWSQLKIGNFKDNSSTSVTQQPGCHWAYYYIDDVTVELSDNQTTIPNVFTPNQDGNNDTFRPYLLEPKKVNARIYDRWGRLMFESNSTYFEWDGKNKGGFQVPDGVYFWLISYENLLGQSYNLRGSVTLIR
jgi:gliding motility-associated-like protein